MSFDDGLVDNLRALVPVLEDEGVPATEGIEIGAHTVTHPDLTRLGFAEALEEMERSRARTSRGSPAPTSPASPTRAVTPTRM